MITWDADVQPGKDPVVRGPFDEIDFVIVDVETTGWSPDEARITEIGAVRVSAGQVQARFSSLVNPHTAIPEQVTELTGISDAMVAVAPPLERVLAAFLDFAHGCVLTAHNAPFDVGFLCAACVACDLRWPDFTVVDTVGLARRVLGEDEVPNCKLSTLAAFFGARTMPRHRALADALATADVLLGLLPRLAAAGVSTIAEMSACQDITRDTRTRAAGESARRRWCRTGRTQDEAAAPAVGWRSAGITVGGTLPAMAGHRRPRRRTWSPRLFWSEPTSRASRRRRKRSPRSRRSARSTR